jgi:hypothetical protein
MVLPSKTALAKRGREGGREAGREGGREREKEVVDKIRERRYRLYSG